MTSRARVLSIVLMGIVLCVVSFRLASRARVLATQGLQADFSAYYFAGKAANAGLSIYQNHAVDKPWMWDGVCLSQRSRFFYPPPAALPFRLLAALPYAQAKAVWTALTLALALTAILLSARLAAAKSPLVVMAAGLWLLAGWPLLLEVERGQIDLVTLVLILGAVGLQRRRRVVRSAGAGLFWALAVLFKLNVILALPFLLLRRRFDVLGSAVVAGVLLVGLSIAASPRDTREYAGQVMPGLVDSGIHMLTDTTLPHAKLAPLFAGRPPTIAHVDGSDYVRFALRFDEHASLIWALGGERPDRPALLSLLAMGLLVAVAWFVMRSRSAEHGDPVDDLGWWALALAGVLLTAPLTWSMNSVWLLPSVFVLLVRAQRDRTRATVLSAAVALLGLVLIAVPDRFATAWPMALHALSTHKYVVGELMVVVALLVTWPKQPTPIVVAAGDPTGTRTSSDSASVTSPAL